MIKGTGDIIEFGSGKELIAKQIKNQLLAFEYFLQI